MSRLVELLGRTPSEAPLLKLPASMTAESLVSTAEWANKVLRPLTGVNKDAKASLAHAVGGYVTELTTIDGLHAVGIRAFEHTSTRPYLTLITFADLTQANPEQRTPETFKKILEVQRKLGPKIDHTVGYGGRSANLKSEQVNDALAKFMTPVKGEQGKVLGAVLFQRS